MNNSIFYPNNDKNENFEKKNYEKKKKNYLFYLLNLFIDGVSIFPGCPVFFYILGIISYHISLMDDYNADNLYSHMKIETQIPGYPDIETRVSEYPDIQIGEERRGERNRDYLYCAVQYIYRYISRYIYVNTLIYIYVKSYSNIDSSKNLYTTLLF